jgi:hypothetical protein
MLQGYNKINKEVQATTFLPAMLSQGVGSFRQRNPQKLFLTKKATKCSKILPVGVMDREENGRFWVDRRTELLMTGAGGGRDP